MKSRADVVIVGGGVGGSALATVLARGRRLRYFERMQADPTLAVGLAVALAGPERLPAEALSEQTRARILER